MRIFSISLVSILISTSFGSSNHSAGSGNGTLGSDQFSDSSETEMEQTENYFNRIDSSKHAQVLEFIKLLEKKDYKTLSSLIEYPLRRSNPLANIKSSEDFIDYAPTLFDEQFMNKLIAYKEKPDIIDRTMSNGKFGILYGLVWFWDGGNLASLNYTSEKEAVIAKKRDSLIKAELHPSIRNFEQNYYLGQAEQFTFRIDWMDENHEQIRYASWSGNTAMSTEPDIILYDGTIEKMGTIGGYQTRFTNGDYTYLFDQSWTGESDLYIGDFLVVLKNNEEIGSARATEIIDELAFIRKE